MHPSKRMEVTPGSVVAMVSDLACGAPHPERWATTILTEGDGDRSHGLHLAKYAPRMGAHMFVSLKNAY